MPVTTTTFNGGSNSWNSKLWKFGRKRETFIFNTLPETNSKFAPKNGWLEYYNGWLEYDPFLLGLGLFSSVSFREAMTFWLFIMFHLFVLFFRGNKRRIESFSKSRLDEFPQFFILTLASGVGTWAPDKIWKKLQQNWQPNRCWSDRNPGEVAPFISPCYEGILYRSPTPNLQKLLHSHQQNKTNISPKGSNWLFYFLTKMMSQTIKSNLQNLPNQYTSWVFCWGSRPIWLTLGCMHLHLGRLGDKPLPPIELEAMEPIYAQFSDE